VEVEKLKGYLKTLSENFKMNWGFMCFTKKEACASSLIVQGGPQTVFSQAIGSLRAK
jgi:hypothetical protein